MSNLNIITRFKELFGLAPRPIPENLYSAPPKGSPSPLQAIADGERMLTVTFLPGKDMTFDQVMEYESRLREELAWVKDGARLVIVVVPHGGSLQMSASGLG
jgi:hypothetical protein